MFPAGNTKLIDNDMFRPGDYKLLDNDNDNYFEQVIISLVFGIEVFYI